MILRSWRGYAETNAIAPRIMTGGWCTYECTAALVLGPMSRAACLIMVKPHHCLRMRARPISLGVATEGRVYNETTKRIDQGHVERSETAHGLHVDS